MALELEDLVAAPTAPLYVKHPQDPDCHAALKELTSGQEHKSACHATCN